MKKENENFGFECEGGIDRRSKIHCEMVIEVTTKFKEFMERYERDRLLTNNFRDKVEKSLDDLLEEIAKLRPPVKIGIWLGITAIGASIIAFFTITMTKIYSKLLQ